MGLPSNLTKIQGTEIFPDTDNINCSGRFKVQFPPTLFTAFIAHMLNFNTFDWAVDAQLLASLAVAIAMQVAICFYLHKAVVEVQGDLAESCAETSMFLQVVALVVFAASWLKDFFETVHVHMWLRTISLGEAQLLQVARFKDDADQLKVEIVRPITSVTFRQKCMFYFLGVIPKFIVSFMIFVCGAGAILRAGTEFDLILNTVAAAFVMEIDDVLFIVFLPVTMKQTSSGLPMVGWTEREMEASWTYWFTEYHRFLFSSAVGVISIAVVRWGYWCTGLTPHTPFSAR